MAKRKSALMLKRRTGPSANTLLRINVATERCTKTWKDEITEEQVRCENHPVISWTKDGLIHRRCDEHYKYAKVSTTKQVKDFTVESFLDKLWNRR